MSKNAPGKSHREGLTLLEIADMFRDEDSAREWLEELRWPDGPYCPHCGSCNVQEGIKHKTMTHRCRDCEGRPMFTLRMGTVMEGTKLKYRIWAIGIYLFTTNLKGISSMKLHRELGVGQKAAWFMLQRLRKAAETGPGSFSGPVESDETYFGGIRKNMSKAKRAKTNQRGTHGKTAVVGAKDRASNSVRAKVIPNTNLPTLQKFVSGHTEPGATIYTDEASTYKGFPYHHEAVKHSVGEYVRGEAHVNGIESFWSLLKRAHKGTFHKISPKHLERYVQEFVMRHNLREHDTIDQMSAMVVGMSDKRLRYADLIADNGLDNGARE
ncbi:MAG: IS1595 family transposase [Gammaproteobacteria bacterium]|nr:IS1595 family transposase [Gammaproteobacteria bacterium]